MKKHYVYNVDLWDTPDEKPDTDILVPVYLAHEVDAHIAETVARYTLAAAQLEYRIEALQTEIEAMRTGFKLELKSKNEHIIDLERRIAEFDKALRKALAFIDELEVEVGRDIRGITYYELKKLVL